MTTEIVYADLELGAASRGGKRLSPPGRGAAPGCPRWHRVALGAGWSGNLLLGVAVVALGCSSVLQQQPQSSGNCSTTNGNVGDINSTQEHELLERSKVLQELREILCLSQPPGAEGCRICPQGWTLGRTKCYWISTGHNTWSKSREHCEGRGATLLLLQDQDELEFLNETLLKSSRSFWIGLWVPEAGTGWMWLNGSRLDQNRFQLDLKERPGQCGTIKGSRIIAEDCGLESQWICQREATKL